MRRSIYLMFTLMVTLAVILPVNAENHLMDQTAGANIAAQQGVESAWIVWETEYTIQRVASGAGRIWAGSHGGGLQAWTLVDGLQAEYGPENGFPGTDVVGLDTEGEAVWLALADGSVVRGDSSGSFNVVSPPGIAGQNAWEVVAEGDQVWVASLGGGASVRSGSLWLTYTSDDGLQSDDIYAVAVAPDGTPWVGTLGYGVAARIGGIWQTFQPPLTIEDPRPGGTTAENQAITDILADPSGEKWMASDGSGVARLGPNNLTWTIYNHANSGLPGDFVQTIEMDSAGNLWFGTLGGGVGRLSADRSSWGHFSSQNSPMPTDDVLDLASDGDGGLWLATYETGLVYYGPLSDPIQSDIDPRGAPEVEFGVDAGFYLWQDPSSYQWTLAWTGDGDGHDFGGYLEADGLIFIDGTDSLESDDEVNTNDNRLQISAQESGSLDIVRFHLDPEVTSITLYLLMDGAHYPWRTHIGGAKEVAGTAPVQIAAPQPVPPVVDAGEDLTLVEGDTAFMRADVHDPDSPLDHTLQWDFGDGTQREGEYTVQHTYIEDGTYDVSFIAEDSFGLLGQDTLTVSVGNASPEVDFFLSPFNPAVGSTVTFEGFVFDRGALDTHSVSWDFGDSSPPLLDAELLVEYTFNTPGEYEVTLTATDDDGGAGEISYPITVLSSVAPELTLPEPLTLDEGEELITSATFTDPDSSSWMVDVDYGDGTDPVTIELNELAPIDLSHTYTDNGLYEVTVSVTDDQDLVDEGSFDVTVLNVPPEPALGTDISIDEGAALNQSIEILDPGTDTWSVEVDWGDGSPLEPVAPLNRIFTVEHVYADDGAYTLEGCVADDDLGTGCASIQVTVQNVAPTVIPGPDASGQEGTPIEVTATFSDPGVLDTHTVSVDWGDDSSSSPDLSAPGQVSASHLYGEDGIYNAEVCVTDDDSGVGCETVRAAVANVAPTVEAGSDWQVDEGELVDLSGASFNDPGFAEVYTAEVDWGDGLTEGVVIPAGSQDLTGDHRYADNGEYIVVLTVNDGSVDAQDSFTATVLNVVPTVAVETASIVPIDEGDTFVLPAITISDPGSADTHTATINWGDGDQEPGVVDQVAGMVTGSHSYPDEYQPTVTICVTDDDGAAGCGSFDITVNNVPPVVVAGEDIEVDEGQPCTGVLATFNDPGELDTHSAVINWGDGTSEAGQLDQASDSVGGSHTYADPDTYSIIVTVCDDANDCGMASLNAVVYATPKGRIQAIKAAIETYIPGDIDPKAKNSMFSKLDAALKSLEKGKDHTAVNQLGAFINYVEAQSGKKIDESAAIDLITRAEEIIDLIEGEVSSWPRNAFNLTSMCRLDKDTGQMRVRNMSDIPQAFTLQLYKGDFTLEDTAPVGDSLWPVPWQKSKDTYQLKIAGYEFVKAIGKNPICEP